MAWQHTPTTRDDILAFVRAHPGTTPSEVAGAFDVDHSTAVYHLHRLARHGRLRARRDGRHLRHFASGCGLCPFMRQALPVLRDPRYGPLLDRVADGVAVRDLHPDPRARTRMRARLLRLERVGLVENERGTWRAAPGTAPCRAAAEQGGVCDQWGRCAISRTWHGAPSLARRAAAA